MADAAKKGGPKGRKKPPTKAQLAKKKKKARALKKRLQLSVPVPEGLKKAWERENRAKAARKKRQLVLKKRYPAKRRRQAARIDKYERIYREEKEERHKNILKARLAGNYFKDADPKVVLIIRIRGINRVSPKVKKVLQLFRLLQVHNAVFVKINKATMNMLKLIQPYVAYGYPNVPTIRSLVYKRGFAKVRHRPGAISRLPIMDNALIEKHLGKHGVETVEDMVFSLFTANSKFRHVSNFLWPFKLNCPRHGYRGRKRRHFNEGGSYGNHEKHINAFVMRML